MEKFKLEIFKKETNSNLEFEELKGDKLRSLMSYLDEKLGSFTNSIDFFSNIRKKMSNSFDVDDINSPSVFEDVVNKLTSINLDNLECYVIWRYPSEVDVFNCSYLTNNWEYVWYADSDEALVIVIPQVNVIALISHYGEVKFQKF